MSLALVAPKGRKYGPSFPLNEKQTVVLGKFSSFLFIFQFQEERSTKHNLQNTVSRSHNHKKKVIPPQKKNLHYHLHHHCLIFGTATLHPRFVSDLMESKTNISNLLKKEIKSFSLPLDLM